MTHAGRMLLLRLPPGLAALSALTLYLYVALSRIGFPYELEWMEGGMFEHVHRFLAGLPIYAPPSVEFTAYIYPPLYYIVGSVFVMLLGKGLPALRLVSLLASLGCFGLIFSIVKHETGSRFHGFLGAGLFAACFRAGGAWFDLARNDSLMLFLVLAGLLVLRTWTGMAGAAAGALLFSLAFFTKQTAILIAAPLAVWCAARGPARIVFAALLAVVSGAGTFWMNAKTGGWYLWYVFDLPRRHAIEVSRIAGFWFGDLLPVLLPAAAMLVLFLWGLRRRPADLWFWLAAVSGLTGGAWFSRIHSGGYDNVLLPAHAALAIGFGAGLHGVEAAPAQGRRWLIAAAVLTLGLAQFGALVYDPSAQIPTEADRDAGDRLVALIEETPGDVWLPFHGHLAALAGKRNFSQGMALDDVFRGRDRATIDLLEADIRQALRERRFGAIIIDYTPWGLFQDDLDRHYLHRGHLFRDPDVLMPRTGLEIRPEELYIRRE